MIRILLAEDDTGMREYLTRALERSGYAVTAVDRGSATLTQGATAPFARLVTAIPLILIAMVVDSVVRAMR